MSVITYPRYGWNAPAKPELPWVKRMDGRYCERHHSWMCGNAQGECQWEFLHALMAVGGKK